MANPVVALLTARRAELTGGVDSVGVQEARIVTMQAELDAAIAHLDSCKAEVAQIDATLTGLGVEVTG